MNFYKIQADVINQIWEEGTDRIALGTYQGLYGLSKDSYAMVLIPKDKWCLNENVVAPYKRINNLADILLLEDKVVEVQKTNMHITQLVGKHNKHTLIIFDNAGQEMYVDKKLLSYFPNDCTYKAIAKNQKSQIQIYEDGQLVGVVMPVKPETVFKK